MTLSAVDWAKQVSCSLGPQQAVAVFHTPDLTLMWSNDAYRALADQPFRSRSVIGLPLREYSEIEYAIRAEALRRVGDGGDVESGEERLFSVEDGDTVYRWSIHPVCPNYALEVVDICLPLPREPVRIAGVAGPRRRRLRDKGIDALSRISRRVRKSATV